MASGYNRNLGRSQIKGSDEIHDHPCLPCSDEGKNSEAVYQCVDCQIFYCLKCLSGHNKFTKDHYVVDNRSKMFGQGKKQVRNSSAELPSYVCEEHHGEVIKMFCKTHDVVCCAVCIAVKHRTCDGVEYIPNIAKGILRRPDTGNMKSSLQKVKEDLQNLKIEMQNELESLNKERGDIMEQIQKFKNRIIARVEKLEKLSLDELQKQHKALADNINANSWKIDDIWMNVEKRLNKLNLSQDVNEAQLFVDINYGEKELRQAIECVKTSADRDVKNMSFNVVKEIEKYLEDTQSLGKTTIISQSRSIPKKHVTDRPVVRRYISNARTPPRHLTTATAYKPYKESSSSNSDEDLRETEKSLTKKV